MIRVICPRTPTRVGDTFDMRGPAALDSMVEFSMVAVTLAYAAVEREHGRAGRPPAALRAGFVAYVSLVSWVANRANDLRARNASLVLRGDDEVVFEGARVYFDPTLGDGAVETLLGLEGAGHEAYRRAQPTPTEGESRG